MAIFSLYLLLAVLTPFTLLFQILTGGGLAIGDWLLDRIDTLKGAH